MQLRKGVPSTKKKKKKDWLQLDLICPFQGGSN